jgi:hypothetical protein
MPTPTQRGICESIPIADGNGASASARRPNFLQKKDKNIRRFADGKTESSANETAIRSAGIAIPNASAPSAEWAKSYYSVV